MPRGYRLVPSPRILGCRGRAEYGMEGHRTQPSLSAMPVLRTSFHLSGAGGQDRLAGRVLRQWKTTWKATVV